jgi:hypothetical protein
MLASSSLTRISNRLHGPGGLLGACMCFADICGMMSALLRVLEKDACPHPNFTLQQKITSDLNSTTKTKYCITLLD